MNNIQKYGSYEPYYKLSKKRCKNTNRNLIDVGSVIIVYDTYPHSVHRHAYYVVNCKGDLLRIIEDNSINLTPNKPEDILNIDAAPKGWSIEGGNSCFFLANCTKSDLGQLEKILTKFIESKKRES